MIRRDNNMPESAAPAYDVTFDIPAPIAEDDAELDDLFGESTTHEAATLKSPTLEKPAAPIVFSPLDGALAEARNGVRVGWVRSGQKFPPVPNFPNVATTDEAQIKSWAKERPNCNFLGLATPEAVCYVDKDATRKLHALYEEKYKEPYPLAHRTTSQDDHEQECWKQTARTRAFGNRVQADFRDGMLSFRQNNEYVLLLGSHLDADPQKGTPARDYKLVDDSPIVEMPDRLMDFFESLLVPKEKTTEVHRDENNQIPHGFIHDLLVKEAGNLRSRGYSIEACEETLVLWARENCAPPLDEDHVRYVARSTKDWPTGNPLQDVVLVGGKIAGATPAELSAPEWVEPAQLDSFLLPPVEQFDIEFLPHALQGWVKDVSERMSVPLDFTGICALVTMAGAVNRRVFIYPKEHDKEWKEALAISGAVVALSGKLKTPTWKCFANVHVELECDWRKEHEQKMAIYLPALDKYKKQVKQMRKDKASEETIAALARPAEPDPVRRLLVNDATPEKLHMIMQDCPEGLLVFRDELSGWIAEMDKEGREGEREIFLCAMNGDDPYTMDRIERGTVTAYMSASLFGGIQPDKLIEFLNDPNNVSDGTFPRFGAVVWPDSSEMQLVDRPANENAKSKFRQLIRTLAATKAKAAAFHFDPKTQIRFNDWLRRHNEKVAAETSSGKQSHLSKYRGLLPKIAALFQLADIVATTQVQPSGGLLVDLEHLDRAIRFVNYLESHVNRIYSQIRNPFQKAEESLVKHIKAQNLKDGFTAREVERKCWDGLSRREYVEDALVILEEKGWVRSLAPEKNAKGGRPTSKWEINPALKFK